MVQLFETRNLSFREIEKNDWIRINEYTIDPSHFLFVKQNCKSSLDTQKYVSRLIEFSKESPRWIYKFAVIHKIDQLLIGDVDLTLSKGFTSANIGFILNKKYWNQGFGYELVTGLIKYAFEEMHLKSVFATCRPENLKAKKILIKAGFKEKCLYENNIKINDQLMDTILMSLKFEDYREFRIQGTKVLNTPPSNLPHSKMDISSADSDLDSQ